MFLRTEEIIKPVQYGKSVFAPTVTAEMVNRYVQMKSALISTAQILSGILKAAVTNAQMLLNAFYQTGEPGVTALSRSAVVVCNEDSEGFWWNLDKGAHSVTIKAKQNCVQGLSAKICQCVQLRNGAVGDTVRRHVDLDER